MKKSKIAIAGIFTLSLAAIAGCDVGGNTKNKETETNEQILEHASQLSAILITNKAVPVRSSTLYSNAYNEIKAAEGGFLKATTELTYLSEANNEYKIEIDWTYDAAQWKVKEYEEEKYTQLRPVYGGFNQDVTYDISATLKFGELSTKLDYTIHAFNDKELYSIEKMPTSGNVAVQGYVTGSIMNGESCYGLYIQDGDYGAMLYSPSYKLVKDLKVGDLVEVTGTGSAYNDTKQINSASAVTVLSEDEKAEGVTKPNNSAIAEATDLNKNSVGQVRKLEGAKVTDVSLVANRYNGKDTENCFLNVKVLFKGKEILITSDRYNTNYDDKVLAYNKLVEIKNSNGAKTLNYEGPVAKVREAMLEEGADANNYGEYVYGFSYFASSYISEGGAYVAQPGMSLEGTRGRIVVDQEFDVTAKVVDLDDTTVTWASSDPAVASVTNGKVKGLKAGTTTISATSTVDSKVKAEFELAVAAGYPVTHDGLTAENALTASEAYTLSIKQGSTNSKSTYFVKGTVKEIKDLSTKYGNATFVITDGTADFDIFRAKPITGQTITEDYIKVNDEVVLTGNLVDYKSNTPQLANGVFYTINGKGAEQGGEEETTALSVSEAIALLEKEVAAGGIYTKEEITVTGEVTSSSYNSKYESYTVWLKDGDTVKAFELYSAKVAAGVTGDWTAKDAMKGKTVTCTGYGQKYINKDTQAVTYEIAYLSAAKSPTGVEVSPQITSIK